MAENDKKKTPPPYLSYKTFQTFLDGLKVAIPSHIDRSIMRNLSGGAQSALISALGYMRLISSDNVPSARLIEIVKAQGPERQDLLRDLWSDTYANLNIDFDSTTSKQLEDALQKEGASGDTIYKCKGFLLALAKAGGLQLSPYLKASGRKSHAPRIKKTMIPLSSGTSTEGNMRLQVAAKTPEQFLFEILDTNKMDEAEQQAVWTLIKWIKRQPIED